MYAVRGPLNLAAFMQLGMAFGPPLLGSSYDALGSYSWGFAGASLLALVAAGLLWPVRPRYWSPPPGREAARRAAPGAVAAERDAA